LRRRASFLAIVDLTPGRRERSILLRHPVVSAPKPHTKKEHLRGRAVPPTCTANDVHTRLVSNAMSLGAILLIILVIALLGGFSGLGGGRFYGTGYYGGGGLGLVLVIVLILVLLGKL
jgi:hypothetical protein